MVHDCFKVVAILGRNPAGDLERIHTPVPLDEDLDVTLIPTTMGIIVITDGLQDEDGETLTEFLKDFLPMN